MSPQFVVVTNRGIGWEVAQGLALENLAVLAVCRCQADADATAAKLRRLSPGAAASAGIALDAACYPSEVDAAVDAIALAVRGSGTGGPGRPDSSQRSAEGPEAVRAPRSGRESGGAGVLRALVNNAAVYLDEWSELAWRESAVTNYLAPIRLAEQLLPLLREGQPGEGQTNSIGADNPPPCVVNVSSGYGSLSCLTADYRQRVTGATSLADLARIAEGGFDAGSAMGREYVAPYKVTKALLNRATQLLAADGENRAVRVHAADPGWCRTRMGGAGATRSAEDGAKSVLAAVLHINGTGRFLYFGKDQEW